MPEKKRKLNWSRMEPDKAAMEVQRMVDIFERNMGWRHWMAMRGAMAYGGLGCGDLFGSLSPWDGPWMSDQDRIRKRPKAYSGWGSRSNEMHARSAADTLHQKICGLDEPKTQMVATDAEWELKRKGVWADRFIEGNFHMPQGTFHTAWSVARHAFLVSACSTGTTGVRIEPDYVSKRVHAQLRSTLNTFIDPGDVAMGRPLSYFDITWENPEYLAEDERFKGQEKFLFENTEIPPQYQNDSFGDATFGTEMVKVVTCWRLPFGEFKGRKCYVIGKKAIGWDDWPYPQPPIAFCRMNRCLGDQFWAENLIEIMLPPLQDAEDIDQMAKAQMRKKSQTYIVGDDSMKGDILNANDVSVLKWDARLGGKDPLIITPEIMSQQYFDYRERKIETARNLSGVSIMHSSGEQNGGVKSGRALRFEASLLPERFAAIQRDWRHFVAVDMATLFIRAAREIGEREPNWQVTWPGADFDSKVKVDVLDIDDSIYELRPYAVSEQKNTPADRAEVAQEMFDRGEISAAQLSVVQNGLLDTPKAAKTDLEAAQTRYVAKVADDILHSEEDELLDENRYMTERYIPPPQWVDPASALAQVLPIYFQALIDGVPQNRRNLLRRFCEDIWALKLQQDRDNAMAGADVSVKATPEQAFPGAPQPGAMPLGPAASPPAPAAPGGLPAPAPEALGAGALGAPSAPPINAGGMGLA